MCRKNPPDDENMKNQTKIILMEHTKKKICIHILPRDSRRKVQCILCLSQPQDHEPASLNSMKTGSTNPQNAE